MFMPKSEKLEADSNRVNGTSLYIGNLMDGFGHFILETLPMLWPTLNSSESYDSLACHRFLGSEIHQWQLDLLNIACGLPVVLVDNEAKRFSKITVGDRPLRCQGYATKKATLVWDYIADSFAGAAPRSKKIFLSRSKLASDFRRYENSSQVEEVFRKLNFEVIHPHELNVKLQIEKMAGAEIVAGQAASALHLAAFSRRKTMVVELGDSRTPNRIVAGQKQISSLKQQPIHHLDFRQSEKGGFDIEYLFSELKRLALSC